PGGLPDDLMEAHIGEGGTIHLENAEAIVRPLRFSVREAVALLVALRALAQLPGVADRDALLRAIAKLEEAAGERGAAASQRVTVAFEARATVLDRIRQALDTGRRLRLEYFVPSRDQVTGRDVDPMRVILSDGHAYLEGWCRRSEATRVFRLSRIVSIEVLDVAADVPEAAEPHDLDEGVLRPAADDPLVTLEVTRHARWVAENYPNEGVEELPEGGLRIALRAPDQGRILRLVLRLGADGRIVDPPALADQVRKTAAEALALYGDGEEAA
ncbi:MAG: WYL domain-containing protein, partial [Catenulisporales bacterium]|nr:WYL domain-containing protein [Catenulisporales bacterium]